MRSQIDEAGGGEVSLGLLGVHMLLNGYTYFIPQLHTLQGVSPLVSGWAVVGRQRHLLLIALDDVM
jgi:hypothetical protein